MPEKSITAKQERSRQSEGRLLKAATEILSERGLEGATIPRIAARAGLSPGAIYRRFPNKDALLRRVFVQVLDANDKGMIRLLESEATGKMDLKSFAEFAVKSSITGQRKYAGLLNAINQYCLDHKDARFTKKIDGMQIQTLRRVVDFLSQKSAEMNHPDIAVAVPFGLMIVGFTLSEMIIRNQLYKNWTPLLPKDDEQLERELTRALLAYLGAQQDNR